MQRRPPTCRWRQGPVPSVWKQSSSLRNRISPLRVAAARMPAGPPRSCLSALTNAELVGGTIHGLPRRLSRQVGKHASRTDPASVPLAKAGFHHRSSSAILKLIRPTFDDQRWNSPSASALTRLLDMGRGPLCGALNTGEQRPDFRGQHLLDLIQLASRNAVFEHPENGTCRLVGTERSYVLQMLVDLRQELVQRANSLRHDRRAIALVEYAANKHRKLGRQIGCLVHRQPIAQGEEYSPECIIAPLPVRPQVLADL